jgi:hypothetical protein
MTLPAGDLSPYRELVRRVEGLAGKVSLCWRFEPRFGFGAGKTRIEFVGAVPSHDHAMRSRVPMQRESLRDYPRFDAYLTKR